MIRHKDSLQVSAYVSVCLQHNMQHWSSWLVTALPASLSCQITLQRLWLSCWLPNHFFVDTMGDTWTTKPFASCFKLAWHASRKCTPIRERGCKVKCGDHIDAKLKGELRYSRCTSAQKKSYLLETVHPPSHWPSMSK